MDTSPGPQSEGHQPVKHGRLAASGLSWAAAAFAADKLLTLGTIAILARILSPAEFGVFASALVVFTVFSSFRDVGLRQ